MKGEVSELLDTSLSTLRQAIDKSVQMVQEGQDKRKVGADWNLFLGEFFSYMKQKSKESNQNLLSWVRLPKI